MNAYLKDLLIRFGMTIPFMILVAYFLEGPMWVFCILGSIIYLATYGIKRKVI